MEGGTICLPQTEVLEMKLVISVRWFHQDVKGEGTDRVATFFVWYPALVVYSFHGHLIFFFYPHPITTKFSLKIFLALNFSLVSTWLHWWAYFHHCLVGVVTALLPLSGTPRAAFGELLLENLICHQSTEHPGVWTHSRKCAGFV